MRFALLMTAVQLWATSVPTAQYDNARDNANTSESVLTHANVTAGKFGKLGFWLLDGISFAQPLVVDGGCAPHSLVTASMHNTLACWNADIPGSAAVWSVNVGTSLTSYTADTQGFMYPTINGGEIGCLATPVVSGSVVYAVCATSAGAWKLYALNLADGSTAHTAVTVSGSNNGVTFVSTDELQRTPLLAANGNIYFGFCGYADTTPYEGWVFAYSASTLTQVAAFAVTNSTNGQGGVWQGSGGLAADAAGHIYFETGNGSWDGTANFGESFMELSSTLAVISSATPANWSSLNAGDIDIGSGRLMLTGAYAMGGGKDGRWWLMHQGALGGLQGSGAGPAQVWTAIPGAVDADSGIFGGEAFANNTLFLSGIGDSVYSFTFGGSSFTTTANWNTTATFALPGATIAYSSNGAASGTDVLWANTVTASAGGTPRPGTLYALDAATGATLWSGSSGTYSKFSAPTVTNGRVYLATFDNTINLYGLLPSVITTGAAIMSGKAVE